MGSYGTECSNLVRFMDAMAEKHEKMQQQKQSNATFANQSIGTNNTALLAKQKADTAKALKAAQNFDFSKVKKQKRKPIEKKVYIAGLTSDKKKVLSKKIIDFHNKNMPAKQIANELKINVATTRMYLLRAGYTPIQSNKYGIKRQKLIDEIIKLHKQGMPLADIVRATKIPRSTARSYLIEAGYKPIPYNKKKGAK